MQPSYDHYGMCEVDCSKLKSVGPQTGMIICMAMCLILCLAVDVEKLEQENAELRKAVKDDVYIEAMHEEVATLKAKVAELEGNLAQYKLTIEDATETDKR